MKQSAYRKQVESDLKHWIERGWVPAESRAPILESLPQRKLGDGRSWIAMAGTILAGLAIIAFIADNWATIPRGLKLCVLMSAFLASAFGAAVIQSANKMLSNALSLLSVLIFSASIALIGQAYNMPGEPSGALLLSAIGAIAIGWSGRSAAAGFAALVFGGIWFGMRLGDGLAPWASPSFWTINLIALAAGALAYHLRARSIWHGVLIAAIGLSITHFVELSNLITYGKISLSHGFDGDVERSFFSLILILTLALWAGLAALGYIRDRDDQPGGRTLAGYGAWVALGSVALLGIPMFETADALHRLIWLAASVFTLWFGARYHFGWVAAAGILSLITAVSMIFVDLGMELSAAALVFGLAAIVSLIVVYVLKKRDNDSDGGTQND